MAPRNSNADSLNNTGLGSETDAGTNGNVGGTALTTSQMPAHSHTLGTGGAGAGPLGDLFAALSNNSGGTGVTSTAGSGSSHDHAGSTWTGTTGANAQPSIAEAAIIRVL